jgi:SAM-dependent methyltransferase
MDMWKFYDIQHRDHTVMDPMSLAKTHEMIELLDLPAGGRVLEIACGKGTFLCLVAERYDVTGTGVDASPFTAADAKRNVEAKGLEKRLRIVHMDGAAYEPPEPASHCLASCIGGSWVYHGHRGTLQALCSMTRPGGLILVGEPFWKKEPDPEYLSMTGLALEQQGTHPGNVTTGEELGLSFLYSVVSSEDDWDRYEGLRWRAAERHAAAHPDDPDNDELLSKSRSDRNAYLRWGRDCVGWAMYLFRKP